MSNCNCHAPANRDGSGRLQRYLTALDPAYAKIDGRSMEELLVFIKRYAAQIRFYDIPGSTGDDTPEDISLLSWREFFRRDFAVTAASIALIDTAAFKVEYDENRAEMELSPTPHHFGNLFDPILGIAAKLDGWMSLAIPGNPLYEDLRRIIQSGLKPAMKKLMAYEEAFRLVDAKHPLKLDYMPIQNDELWGLNDEIIPDSTIYAGTSPELKMLNAILFVDDIFNTFYGILLSLVNDAGKYMQYAMEKYPAHQPHMALFLSFLQLFAIAQEQMNGITERMLNFYYRDVLHLAEKPSIPDRVYIIFELAKDIFQYDIAKATSLNAGTDNSGKDQVYLTNSDLVVNQAVVKELKTIFIQKGEVGDSATRSMVPSINAVYARPIAKSADGFGEKFVDPNGKWYTFGQGTPLLPDKLDIKNPCSFIEQAKALIGRKDQAQVGFAIASPQLLLQGGKRIIKLQISNLQDLVGSITVDTAIPQSPFEIYLTGEKKWIDAGKPMTKATYDELSAGLDIGLINPFVEINEAVHFVDAEKKFIFIYLPIAVGAVNKFDDKLHAGYDIQTNQPVLRVMLRKGFTLSEEAYQKIEFSFVGIDIQVGSIFLEDVPPDTGKAFLEKVKQEMDLNNFEDLLYFDGLPTMILQNDDGLIDPEKPFDPFTLYPFPGKSFYIGSEEVFNKPLGKSGSELGINIFKTADTARVIDNWYILNNRPGSSDDLNKYSVALLQNRSWQSLSAMFSKTGIFTQAELNNNILFKLNSRQGDIEPIDFKRLPIETPITEFTRKTNKGFLRISNLRNVNIGPIITSASAADSQEMAPSMQIKEISINYRSQLFALEANTDQFFHIYPFGAVEVYINTPEELKNNRPKKSTSLRDILRQRAEKKFDESDKIKDSLLVQAYNKLLPQFTFRSSYDDFNKTEASRLADIPKTAAFDFQSVVAYGAGINKLQRGNNQYSGDLQEQGMLLIGIEKLQPLQSISLLFQFADGTAEDEDQDPPVIHWSYLTNNEWRPLNGENLVADDTYGFQTTGIIKIDVPEDASTNNTIITSGLTWFMASVEKDSNRIPMLIDVVAQAVEATFIDNNNDQSHFDQALPAATISKLSIPVAEVSKVTQPFSSFDGKHKEVGKEYYMRVSERLRHKGRAINSWDYEHLVLDRFPSIYKVKAINHTDPECLCRNPSNTAVVAPPVNPGNTITPYALKYNVDLTYDEASLKNINAAKEQLKNNPESTITGQYLGTKPEEIAAAARMIKSLQDEMVAAGIIASRMNFETSLGLFGLANLRVTVPGVVPVPTEPAPICCGPQVAPGHVLIVPIADLKNRNAVNPLQPKTGRRTLLEIEEYLKKRVSPFVKVHAKNPVYEQIMVAFRVKFYTGTDKGFYLKKLNDEIVRFLTPWAFDEKAEVKFGTEVYSSSIINFIEERPYVDFITDFFMFVCRDECCPPTNDTNGDNRDNKDTVAEILSRFCDCKDFEDFLQSGFDGLVVARPSTPRSILVSVPQHIIVPYTEPEPLSDCEKRALKKTNTLIIEEKSAPVKATKPATALQTVPRLEKPLPDKPATTSAETGKKVAAVAKKTTSGTKKKTK